VGWLWFLGTLVPMSGIVPIGPQALADRYAYIPMLGIFVIVCWGAAELVERWRVPMAASAACAAAILMLLGIALHRQVGLWGDNVTLWTHTLNVTQRNFVGEENLATALIAQGRAAEAFPHFQEAHRLRPNDPLAGLNVATYQQMLGNYQVALQGYASIIESGTAAPPLLATTRANSGYAHLSLKQYEDAQQDFEAALRAQPSNSAAYRGLGLLAQRAGDIAQATQDFQRSVDLQPSPVGYLLLAQALEMGKRPEAARAAQSEARHTTTDFKDDLAVVHRLLAD